MIGAVVHMRVADVMSAPAITVTAAAPLKRIILTLLEHEISAVPVVDETTARLVGIVTEADLLCRPAYGSGHDTPLQLILARLGGDDPQWLRKADGLTAGDVMTHLVESVRPHTDLHVAARKMLEHRVKRLVVTDDDDRVVGIVSRRDILGTYAPPDEDIAAATAAVLTDVRWVPETIEVDANVSGGVVTLEGSVLHPSDRRVVDYAVRSVPGVIDVVDHLAARESEPLTE